MANRVLIATVLESLGFEVDQVTDGQKAVRAVAADPGRHALVLMDMQMPIMDGVTATRAILELPDPPPIIGLTADAMSENHAVYLAAGLREVLIKPVDWARLERALATHARDAARQADPPPRQSQTLPQTLPQTPPESSARQSNTPGAHTIPTPPVTTPLPSPSEPISHRASAITARAGTSPPSIDEPRGGDSSPDAARQTDEDTAPLFVPTSLDSLSLHLGADRIAPIVQSMLINMENQIRTLVDAADTGDEAAVRRTGHSLKGLAGQFGAIRLAHLCEHLQDPATDGGTLVILVPRARTIATATRIAVDRWLESVGAAPDQN